VLCSKCFISYILFGGNKRDNEVEGERREEKRNVRIKRKITGKYRVTFEATRKEHNGKRRLEKSESKEGGD